MNFLLLVGLILFFVLILRKSNASFGEIDTLAEEVGEPSGGSAPYKIVLWGFLGICVVAFGYIVMLSYH